MKNKRFIQFNVSALAVLGGSLALALPAFAEAASDAAFAAECRVLAERAAAAKEAVVKAKDGWLFLAPELRHLGATNSAAMRNAASSICMESSTSGSGCMESRLSLL